MRLRQNFWPLQIALRHLPLYRAGRGGPESEDFSEYLRLALDVLSTSVTGTWAVTVSPQRAGRHPHAWAPKVHLGQDWQRQSRCLWPTAVFTQQVLTLDQGLRACSCVVTRGSDETNQTWYSVTQPHSTSVLHTWEDRGPHSTAKGQVGIWDRPQTDGGW